MGKKTTDELLELIRQENRLNLFLENNADEFEDTTLSSQLTLLLEKYKLTKASVVRGSLLDKTYTYQIFDGTKSNPSRNKLLAICLSMGLTLSETQHILRLGHAEQLHPRNIRDSVIIHSLNHHVSVAKTNDILFDLKKDIIE